MSVENFTNPKNSSDIDVCSNNKNTFPKTQSATNGVNNSSTQKKSSDSNRAMTDAERLAARRRSLVPMSSMEEENLRERLHVAQLKQCGNMVFQEARYMKDSFKRLMHSQVSD